MAPGLVKELSDVIRSSGFFCLSALLSSTRELIVHMRVTSGLQDGGCSASYNYIQGRKQKGPGENEAAFLSGKKSISQKLHRKGPFMSHWPGLKGNAARETGKVRVRHWGWGRADRMLVTS